MIHRPANTLWKTLAALAVVLAALVVIGIQWGRTHPDLQAAETSVAGAPTARGPEGRPGPPSPEQREQFRAQMVAELNLTPEQQAQMEAIRERSDGDWRAMREEIQAVLTPEQRQRAEAMREERFARMRARMMEDAQVLDLEQRERFEQRLEERRRQWEERRGGGPRPNESGAGA